MCRAHHENGGRRCLRTELSRRLASARQRISRYGRRAEDAETNRDLPELEKNLKLFTKAMSDHDELEGRESTDIPEAESVADRYTVEATSDMSDEELICRADDLWHDPAAQDAIMDVLAYRQEHGSEDPPEDGSDSAAQSEDETTDDGPAGSTNYDAEEPAASADGWGPDADPAIAIDSNPLTNPSARRNETATERVRAEYDSWQLTRWDQAEAETNGYMVNADGVRAGISSSTLFYAPAATVRRYASPELLTWFQRNGHMSLAAFRYSALRRPSDRKAWERSQREAFANAAA
ncbi:hypothetical protein GS504_00895 [Rhodococcus hoagii]|nr:hypothetical protein [Prescottella equi]NKS72201.1 hypothetical protein [Prescottella equi]